MMLEERSLEDGWVGVKQLYLTGVAFAALIAGPAMAADFAVPALAVPVFSWEGFYVGANVGRAWGHSLVNSIFACPTTPTMGLCPYDDPANLGTFSSANSGSLTAAGLVAGGQAGYNLQTGPVVYGVEVDFNSFHLSGSQTAGGLVPVGVGQSFLVGANFDTHWLFTARGRLGWTVAPQILLYATGGLAVTSMSVGNSFTDNAAAFGFANNVNGSSSTSAMHLGYAVGGGAEWALSGNLSVKAEYMYVDFSSVRTTTLNTNLAGATVADVMYTSVKLHANVARIGLNYKFGYTPVVTR